MLKESSSLKASLASGERTIKFPERMQTMWNVFVVVTSRIYHVLSMILSPSFVPYFQNEEAMLGVVARALDIDLTQVL